MTDTDLEKLAGMASTETPDPLNQPGPTSLRYLERLDLKPEDLEALLGNEPGLSWVDLKRNTAGFFVRLRLRVSRLVCNDRKLRDEVTKGVQAGAEAAWVALIVAVGITPGSIAAAALKPIAAALIVSGAGTLCRGSGQGLKS